MILSKKTGFLISNLEGPSYKPDQFERIHLDDLYQGPGIQYYLEVTERNIFVKEQVYVRPKVDTENDYPQIEMKLRDRYDGLQFIVDSYYATYWQWIERLGCRTPVFDTDNIEGAIMFRSITDTKGETIFAAVVGVQNRQVWSDIVIKDPEGEDLRVRDFLYMYYKLKRTKHFVNSSGRSKISRQVGDEVDAVVIIAPRPPIGSRMFSLYVNVLTGEKYRALQWTSETKSVPN